MDIWQQLKQLSFKFFGRSLEPFINYFDSIKPDLIRANIGLSLQEYVYIMFLVILGTFIIEFPSIVIITSLLLHDAINAFLLSFTMTVVILIVQFFLFYTYPSMAAGRRKKNIDSSLSFATTYMATIATSGAPPITMFKVMSEFKDYGEISQEMGKIYRDVEAFGMELVEAIRKTASRTPSEELKELLWGLETMLSSGGNVGNYLHEKSRLFIAEYRRSLEKYSRTLSMLIEVYLTVVLIGSIFFIIMTALMSIIGGTSSLSMMFLQFAVIFLILPFVSVGFILLVKTISPSA
ncbi:MAG: type II secretion system F family protein [Candidatus Aenigmarchaeota archaeon]|nr:type II secretion system F family protein [Candidatus Aenigmarchaeota archaeon]